MACCRIMRMNIKATAVTTDRIDPRKSGILITLRPACLLPGDYSYTSTSGSLLRLLRLKTDLPTTVLEKFESGIFDTNGANLPAVEINEKTLTEIGYFVD